MSFLFACALAEEAETAAETQPGYFETLFEKIAGLPATVWIALAALLLLGAVLMAIGKNRKKLTAKAVSYGAIAVALSFVLSCIRLYRMPQGGSVTPGSMLPILFFSASFGIGPGLAAGLIDGLLQYLEGGWFLNVWQVMLDYFLAYAALGLCGLYRVFTKKNLFKNGLFAFYLAMLIAILFRGLSATLAGYVFWDTAFWPSVVYNCTYLIPEFAVCCLLAVPLYKPVMQVMKR